MWVYRITNIVNGKCYVGVTRNLEKRWRSHRLAVNYFQFKNPLYSEKEVKMETLCTLKKK